MALRAKVTVDTTGIVISGSGTFEDDQTLEQDAGETIALAPFTVLAKKQSSAKLVVLEDINPALTSAKMVCGAIDGTGPEFQAVSDGEFDISVDGEALSITGLDFSGLDTEADTPGYWLCGANGDVIGNWDALTDAAFSYVVDGVAYDTGAMNLTLSVDFGGLIDIINFHLNGHATMEYAFTVDKFQLVSNTTGETSSITIGAPSAGTDISAAGYLNAAAGGAVAGTGGESLFESISGIINAAAAGRFMCDFDGDAMVFYSLSKGLPASVITVLSAVAAGAGTDISGVGFLNGLTGTGTVTAATGEVSTSIPYGIFWGSSVTAAAIVAADVTNRKVLIAGNTYLLDEDDIVLRGSLALTSIVAATGKTISQHFRELGILFRDTSIDTQVAPI